MLGHSVKDCCAKSSLAHWTESRQTLSVGTWVALDYCNRTGNVTQLVEGLTDIYVAMGLISKTAETGHSAAFLELQDLGTWTIRIRSSRPPLAM